MEDLPSDLRGFLLNHPFLQLTDDKKVGEQTPACYSENAFILLLAVMLTYRTTCAVKQGSRATVVTAVTAATY